MRPKSRRGSGFSRPKRGRGKNERGHGRGGRPRKSVEVVGELDFESSSSDTQTESCTESDGSNDTSTFQNALLSSDSDASTSALDSELESSSSFTSHASSSSTSNVSANVLQPPSLGIQMELMSFLRAVLPNLWIPVLESDGVYLFMLSRGSDKAIQRNVYMKFDGTVRVTAHRRALPTSLHEEIVSKGGEATVLAEKSVRAFVDRSLKIVHYVRSLEICAGADYKEVFEHLWKGDSLGCVDNNNFDECSYEKTFRAETCVMLVPVRKWRCSECKRVTSKFRGKKLPRVGVDFNPNTPNVLLTEEQKLHKLQQLHHSNRKKDRKIDHIEKRIAFLLERDGIVLEQDLSNDITDVLSTAKLTPLQALFIQQQQKAASCKNAKGMRWHPAMIRLALLIKSQASNALDSLRSAGLSFPSDRTLYDYSHVEERVHGVKPHKIQKISDHISKFENSYQHFHNLLMDEIYISQKLVYQKSTGRMVGYVKLNEVEQEIMLLTNTINGEDKIEEPPLAKTMLTYMIKGVCNDVKEVVASFTANALTAEFLYDRTWDVITRCEVGGVKILAVVCDGSSANRLFFKMHQPATEVPSEKGSQSVVFDTLNLCSPDRKLYFISDTPHLLKTIRNCFAKSGTHHKAKRLLTKNNETIVWSTIVRLYLNDHENTWRQNCKLNSVNVYLNSYSCMKVLYAAQVMSHTTAMDLKTRNWKGTDETVKFIDLVNNFFDCLNGAHTQQGKRTANKRLEPYTDANDTRFHELQEFLNYLEEWKREVNQNKKLTKKQKENSMLSKSTLEGIQITVGGFTGAVRYMLEVQKAKFVNARVFNQDPLEQYFGKQRASLGGKHNPNVEEFDFTDEKISRIRDFNVRKRSGNTEAVNKLLDVSDEPLPKKKSKV
ncbi:Transposable element P transposase [Frankliniella fusca]|uniref:Transposable element P transposase n=1 Tax=Frankliniella fusca TaxID=407009 RepID=A0AAE1HXL4_9NEOP|nr:Transposable element P transposase [Frankliniella fusca]